MSPTSGTVTPTYEPVRAAFEQMIAADPDFSAQVCAYVDGALVVDLCGGPHSTADSIQGVYSATKGALFTCIALLIQRGLLDPDSPVTRYWPEFGAAGKDRMTVRQLLSHQAGLPVLEGAASVAEFGRDADIAQRLAGQRPVWQPGAAHGYHGLTIGPLGAELVRRTTGVSVQEFYRDEVQQPRGIDLFLGVPPAQRPRVVDVLPAVPGAAGAAPRPQRGSLSYAAATQVRELTTLERLANDPVIQAAGWPAAGGVGSARGLALLYAACISDAGGPPLLTPQTVATVGQLQAAGDDLILEVPTRFAIGFQKPDARLPYGSYLAFGHDGMGGAIGFADPYSGIAFGYVPRRFALPGGADARGLRLAEVLRATVRRR